MFAVAAVAYVYEQSPYSFVLCAAATPHTFVSVRGRGSIGKRRADCQPERQFRSDTVRDRTLALLVRSVHHASERVQSFPSRPIVTICCVYSAEPSTDILIEYTNSCVPISTTISVFVCVFSNLCVFLIRRSSFVSIYP